MAVLLDALVIFVLALTVWFSYRRGFLRTLLSIISYAVGLFVAGFLGKMLSGLIFDKLLTQPITQNIVDLLNHEIASGGVDAAASQLADAVPAWFSFAFLGGSSVSDVAGQLLQQQNVSAAAAAITTQIVRPAMMVVLTAVLFFLLFALCRMLFHFLYRLVGVFNHIPLVGLVNGLLGGLLGVVKAVLYLLLLALVAWGMILLTGDSLGWLNSDIVHDTHLFWLFYKINPLAW